MKKSSLYILGFGLGFAGMAEAGTSPMVVNPVTSSQSGAPASGLVSRGLAKELTITLRNSCFGTNLRNISNPLAPSSVIHAKLKVMMGTKELPLQVSYPALLVTAAGLTSGSETEPVKPTHYNLPKGSSVAVYGNAVVMKVPNNYKITVSPDGEVTSSGTAPSKGVRLISSTFVQEVTDCSGPAVYGEYGLSRVEPAYPCEEHMGKNGKLSANISGVSVSSDKSNIEIAVAFPGQTAFCGGYFSPLMLFFNDKRPDFEATVDFPVGPTKKTHWPSYSPDHALLVLDRNGDGKITERNELFGDQEKIVNGFEMLKLFDENGDGFIDASDEVYGRLMLWYDNGDGVSDSTELVPLASKVKKIGLKYDVKVRPLGRFGEEREQATFWTKSGQKRRVVDIWFAPVQ